MTANSDEGRDRSTVEPLEIEIVRDEEARGLISKVDEESYEEFTDENMNMKKFRIGISLISFLFLSIVAMFIYFNIRDDSLSHYPSELLGNAYNSNDFHNELNIVPPYWDELDGHQAYNNGSTPHMGPCFLPETEPNWSELIEHNKFIKSEKYIKYKDSKIGVHDGKSNMNLAGLCRPGFIIIGAGKCGTSSLYHYLVGHPRVLPAKTKQIHYFKYFTNRPMQWYLQNFPPAEVFLSNGALMTGEASPGYLPYPDVANRLKTWMQTNAGNGEGQAVGSPKIITIVRNPLERSWSSYKYNYRQPLIDKLRKKDMKKKENHDDEWYKQNFVFSFEDLIAAELKALKQCLKPGGKAERAASYSYGIKQWATPEFSRRNRTGLPHMVVLDESCYGGKVSKSVPRRQWKNMVLQHPNKIINVQNLHLVQSLVGRSLYALPLEWWYALYPKKDLFLFCSEDLRFRTSQSMSSLTNFLGLPTFDFTNVTSTGMYNMGGNTGYDSVTEWDNGTRATEDIPISNELRKEYMEFVAPYNERLYEVVGKRCNWG